MYVIISSMSMAVSISDSFHVSADLVILGMVTREPNVAILREADTRRTWLNACPGSPYWLPELGNDVEASLAALGECVCE